MPATTTFPRTGHYVPPSKDKKKESAAGPPVASKMGNKFGRYSVKEALKATPVGQFLVNGVWKTLEFGEDPAGEFKKEAKNWVADIIFQTTLGVNFRDHPTRFLFNLTQNAPKTLFLFAWNGFVRGEYTFKKLGYHRMVNPKTEIPVPPGVRPGLLINQPGPLPPAVGTPRVVKDWKGVIQNETLWVPREQFKLFSIKTKKFKPGDGSFWDKISGASRAIDSLVDPINWLNGNVFYYWGWENHASAGNTIRIGTQAIKPYNVTRFASSRSIRFISPLARTFYTIHSALTLKVNDLERIAFQQGSNVLRSYQYKRKLRWTKFGAIPIPHYQWFQANPYTSMDKDLVAKPFLGNYVIGGRNIKFLSQEGLAQLLYYLHPVNIIKGWGAASRLGWEEQVTNAGNVLFNSRGGFYPQFNRILFYLHPRNWLLNGETWRRLGWQVAENIFQPLPPTGLLLSRPLPPQVSRVVQARISANRLENFIQGLARLLYRVHPASWRSADYSWFINTLLPLLRGRSLPWALAHSPRWWQNRTLPWLQAHNPTQWLSQRRQWQNQAFNRVAATLTTWWTTVFLTTPIGRVLLRVWGSRLVQFLVNSRLAQLLKLLLNNPLTRILWEAVQWIISPQAQLLSYAYRFLFRPLFNLLIKAPIKFVVDAIRYGPKAAALARQLNFLNDWNDLVANLSGKKQAAQRLGKKIKDFVVDRLWDPLRQWFLRTIVTPLKNFFHNVSSQGLRQALAQLWQGLLSNLNNLWTAFLNGPIGSALSSAWTSLTGWITSTAVPAITGFLSTAWTTISGAVGTAWTSLMGALGISGGTAAGGAGLGATLSGIAGAVGGAIGTVMAAVGTVTTTVIGGIAGVIAAPEELVVLIVVLIIVLIVITIVLLVAIFYFGYIIVTTKAPAAQELGVTVALEKKVKIDHLWTNTIATADGQDHLVEFFLYARSLTDKKATDFKIHDIDINGQSRDFNLGTGFELGGGEVKEIEAARYGVNLNASYPRIVTNVFLGQAVVDGSIVQFSNVANVIIDPSLISELPPCGSPTTGTITTLFGQIIVGGPEPKHTGIDIASDLPFWKQDVYSPMDGAVSAAISGPFKGMVSVKSVNGLYQVDFVHLSNYVNVLGKAVRKGDKIGDTYIGPIPGYSSGTHLHYRVKKNGQIVDPMNGEFSINTRAVGEHINVTQDCGTWTPH